MQAISAEVKALLPKFSSVKFEHVRREFNKEADAMVNQALDAEVGPRS
jgi:ribonuclease HI